MRGFRQAVIKLKTLRGHDACRSRAIRFYQSSVNSENLEKDDLQILYMDKVRSGLLKEDDHQKVILEKLSTLNYKLSSYQPPSSSKWTKYANYFRNSEEPTSIPAGVYIYGSVGTGKTLLMDMFYQTCSIPSKCRIHFHEFMIDVHKRLHEMKKRMPKSSNKRGPQPYDPITPVANEIAQNGWLLCFDEFQVTDIADAMILKRLFSGLWANGVVVVATSNRQPKDLYKNGLQRINFVPFIGMLEKKCDVVCLDSHVDYRRRDASKGEQRYFIEGECNTEDEMDRIFRKLASYEDAREGQKSIYVLGRTLVFPKTCGRILDCYFEELCSRALGAVDYLQLCETFDCVFIRNIPTLSLQKRSEVRRFVTLIDTFYDNQMRLICSAAAPPDEIFRTQIDLPEEDIFRANVLKADLDIKKGDVNEAASIFTGEEELFAFDRVVSRLSEMQTDSYWEKRGSAETRLKKLKKVNKVIAS